MDTSEESSDINQDNNSPVNMVSPALKTHGFLNGCFLPKFCHQCTVDVSYLHFSVLSPEVA